MTDKIKVISAANGRCIINNRDLGIRRIWPGRGSVIVFTKEQIEGLMYDPAFSNMVNSDYTFNSCSFTCSITTYKAIYISFFSRICNPTR